VNNATPLDLAAQELPAAVDAIGAGDENATAYARGIRKLVSDVNNASARALGSARQLHEDDVMNPQGKARKLAEIPANLMAATSEQLEQAETDLIVIEALHLAAILKHDPRQDSNLRAELDNYTVNLKQDNVVATLVQLAADPRYSTYLSGPMGRSLAARFNFDAGIFTKTALQALAVDGTEDQVRRSKALAAIPAARRVIALAKGGRDQAAAEAQKAPKPAPSTAMMS
jgi:hypothetical protein